MMKVMFDMSFGEMIMLAAIALIAIGPKQLPAVARTVGKLIGEFKKAVGDVTSTVASAREETDRAIRKVTDELTSATKDITKDLVDGFQLDRVEPHAGSKPLQEDLERAAANARAIEEQELAKRTAELNAAAESKPEYKKDLK